MFCKKNIIDAADSARSGDACVKEGLFLSAASLWAMFIALTWNNEEPDKIRTVLVVFIVFVLGLLIIRFAKNKGIITSTRLWTCIFLIKLTLILIVLQYFWLPTFPVHRLPSLAFDPIVYDYYGKILAESNFNVHLIFRVYNYVGQIFYIGAIYWLFGVSTFYVGLFNGIISLITFLAMAAILVDSSGNIKNWRLIGIGMFFPELIYYDAIPGKEVLATCMIVLCSLLMYKIWMRKKTKFIIPLLLSLAVLISVRASMAIAVVAIGGFWLIAKSRHRLKSIILYLSIVSFMLLYAMPKILDYSGGYLTDVRGYLDLAKRASYGIMITPGEKSLNVLFASANPVKAIIFAPIRMVFYLVAPFPRLTIDLSEILTATAFARLSVWVTLLCFPILIAATFQGACRKIKSWFFIVFSYWLLLLLIANGGLFIHERYRVMADPFFIATLLVGIKYGNPKRYVLCSFIFIILGFVLYYLLKQVA